MPVPRIMDAVQRCSFGEFYIPHPPATASSTREGTLTHNTDGQRRVGASAADAGGGGAVNAAAATRHGLPDMDAGRLRHLIRSGDLAPCFDGADDAVGGYVEECPICFYFYPSLNRSKCCGKGICTECFLQLMPSKTSEAVHCPFCKIMSYAIEYRGTRTRSEKKFEQEEVEKNVNETKIVARSKSQIAGEIILF